MGHFLVIIILEYEWEKHEIIIHSILDLIWLMDRNFKVSYGMVDDLHSVSIFMNKFDIRD